MLRDIASAVTLLTALPLPSGAGALRGGRAADHFALVGLLFGVVGAAVGLLATHGAGAVEAELLGFSLVLLWAALSRGLHWDGLADVADAWTVPPDERATVLKDSRIGAFGVLVLVGVFAIQGSSFAVVLSRGGTTAVVVCCAVPVLGRLAASFAAWFGAPLSQTGLGASVTGSPGIGALSSALVIAGVAYAMAMGGHAALVALTVGLVCAAGLPRALAKRFGGVNGDIMGAAVALTETAATLAAAISLTVTA